MPSPRLTPKLARFLGAQMMLVIGGTNVTITWIAFTVIFLALALIHLIFARQLFSEAKGVRRGIESW
jgi:hypothetical protein